MIKIEKLCSTIALSQFESRSHFVILMNTHIIFVYHKYIHRHFDFFSSFIFHHHVNNQSLYCLFFDFVIIAAVLLVFTFIQKYKQF